jgi:uncharacterized membrane protein
MTRLTLWAPFLLGLLLLVPGLLGMAGRLPRNDWVGIRMHVVMRDERTWRAGHKAGGPWLAAAGLVAIAGGAVLAVWSPSRGAANAFSLGVLLAAFVLSAVGAWRAQAGARHID